jgi:hypothetical protein
MEFKENSCLALKIVEHFESMFIETRVKINYWKANAPKIKLKYSSSWQFFPLFGKGKNPTVKQHSTILHENNAFWS